MGEVGLTHRERFRPVKYRMWCVWWLELGGLEWSGLGRARVMIERGGVIHLWQHSLSDLNPVLSVNTLTNI